MDARPEENDQLSENARKENQRKRTPRKDKQRDINRGKNGPHENGDRKEIIGTVKPYRVENDPDDDRGGDF